MCTKDERHPGISPSRCHCRVKKKKEERIGWFTLAKKVCLQSQHALIFKDVSHINSLWLSHSELLHPIMAAVREKRRSWFLSIRKGNYSINLHGAFPSMCSFAQCLKFHCLGTIFMVLKSYLAENLNVFTLNGKIWKWWHRISSYPELQILEICIQESVKPI